MACQNHCWLANHATWNYQHFSADLNSAPCADWLRENRNSRKEPWNTDLTKTSFALLGKKWNKVDEISQVHWDAGVARFSHGGLIENDLDQSLISIQFDSNKQQQTLAQTHFCFLMQRFCREVPCCMCSATSNIKKASFWFKVTVHPHRCAVWGSWICCIDENSHRPTEGYQSLERTHLKWETSIFAHSSQCKRQCDSMICRCSEKMDAKFLA